jgi:hypothetical protein
MELYLHSPIRLHGLALKHRVVFMTWYLVKHRDLIFYPHVSNNEACVKIPKGPGLRFVDTSMDMRYVIGGLLDVRIK